MGQSLSNWVRVAAAGELAPGECGEYVAGERIIALFNVGGTFHALDGICPHQGGPLGKGTLCGSIVTCPWHGFQFDVTTGQHQTSRSIVHPQFAVKVEAGEIYIDLPAGES
jgi:nitrite reductase/ring-hydroxylating ferredoxin subunit